MEKSLERLIYYKNTDCQLYFEQLESFFWVGEKLKGVFTINNNSKLEIDEIFILVEGLVEVCWEESVMENRNGIAIPTIVKFHGNDILLYLFNQIYSKDVIPVTGKSYPFEILIPSDAIPSCIVKHGSVKYELSALCRHKDTNELKSFFTVPIIIRKSIVCSKELRTHNAYELTKYSWNWWPCKPKPITAVIKLYSSVYYPGDTINYNISMIEPATFKCIQKLSFHIIQIQYLQASKPYQKQRQEYIGIESQIFEQELSYIKNKSYDGSFLIPNTVSISYHDKCILQIGYKLQVSLAVYGGIGIDSTIAIPIKICHNKLKAPVKTNLNTDSCK